METVHITYNRPNQEDFLAGHDYKNNKFRERMEKYPFLFEYLCSPNGYLAMIQFTDASRPAVAGVAESCVDLLLKHTGSGTEGEINKFIGAIVGFILLANGYEKLDKQRSIGRRDFTDGEVYRRKG